MHAHTNTHFVINHMHALAQKFISYFSLFFFSRRDALLEAFHRVEADFMKKAHEADLMDGSTARYVQKEKEKQKGG